MNFKLQKWTKRYKTQFDFKMPGLEIVLFHAWKIVAFPSSRLLAHSIYPHM